MDDRHDEAERRHRNLLAVQAAFEGVSAADAERQLANYTDDMVLELPYDTPPTRLEGKATVLARLSRAFRTYKMRIAITEVHECVDPDELIIEFTSEGHMATTGKPYANRYIGVFRFRDGKICAQREFFNPKISDEALRRDEPAEQSQGASS
jgi:ketosteroid isomerase-like protein